MGDWCTGLGTTILEALFLVVHDFGNAPCLAIQPVGCQVSAKEYTAGEWSLAQTGQEKGLGGVVVFVFVIAVSRFGEPRGDKT